MSQQRILRSAVISQVFQAIQAPEYANLDDDQKAKVITDLRTIAKDIADHDIGGKALSDSKQKNYDLYKSEGADAVIQKKIVGKILNDAGVSNTEKNQAKYEEQGQQFIEQKSAEQELKETYGVSGDNAMYAYNNGVTGEELQALNTMELYPGKKGDYRDYADFHQRMPEIWATPNDYKRIYGDMNAADPKTKSVSQTDMINYFNSLDPNYIQKYPNYIPTIIDIYWDADAKSQPELGSDGIWRKVKH